MLFNSLEFLLAFLPIVLGLFYFVRNAFGNNAARWVLVAASLVFYGYWSRLYLTVLIGSMLFNYYIGVLLGRGSAHPKLVLAIGIAVDLALLAYFKYTNFFLTTINDAAGTSWSLGEIILPLGISFFTFQQISYRMECYLGHRKNDTFLNYVAAVTFFPHLVAGPIVLYQELMPQFNDRREENRRFVDNFPVGISIFVVGLFKKVIIADSLAPHVNPVFAAASPGFGEAWSGALAYTFQLYFDFSGYSDMAIGLACMFGIRFPANFNSPYKAVNILDFWRRWHMTLSRFLRDYLYIPLGGNRRGLARQCSNLMVTMLLGGLWHGAGWGFVLWGALHGTYLVVNHVFRRRTRALRDRLDRSRAWALFSRAITFVAVVIAWVPFRATSLAGTKTMWSAMFSFPSGGLGIGTSGLAWIGMAAGIAFFMPNAIQVFAGHYGLGPVPPPRARLDLRWQPTTGWALLLAGIAAMSFLSLNRVSEFLYFQF